MNSVKAHRINRKFFTTRREAVSLLLLASFFALSLLVVFINPQLYRRHMREGDIALADIYAPRDFSYTLGINEDGTRLAREKAMDLVPFYISRSGQSSEKAYGEAAGFLDALTAKSSAGSSITEKINDLRMEKTTTLSDKNLRVLLEYTDKEKLKNDALQILKNILQAGYISEEDLAFLRTRGVTKAVVCESSDDKGIERSVAALVNNENILFNLGEQAQNFFGDDKRIKQAVTALVSEYAEPDLVLDKSRTENERQAAAAKVRPELNTFQVSKNELIVKKGEKVDGRHLAQLAVLKNVLEKGKSRGFFLGIVFLLLILGLVGSISLVFTDYSGILRNPKVLSIILLCMLMTLVGANFIVSMSQSSYFIPLAGMGMMITMLAGFDAAFICVVLEAVFLSVLLGGKMDLAVVLVTGSVVGMYVARAARKRPDILWAGLFAGMANFFSIVCVGLINGAAIDISLKDGLGGVLSGVFSGVFVMGLLPIFENVFRVPTNISLLEMSDLNHPLLKRLALEAPGTYHHSLLMGSLAEAACESIHANSLLARIGAYFHDVGKLYKPQYFSENEMGLKSKHVDLTPSMSSLIIANHVKEGVDLARKYKLNPAIMDLIREHHGTGLIAFFYQKALENQDGGNGLVDEKSFRYEGPKPQTKEAAIILLADSVEASSRTMSDPTPSSLAHLVKRIINNRFIDGQLEECDLTLKDMHLIADAFLRVLMGIFHTRTQYPDEKVIFNGAQINGKNKLRK